MWTGVAGISPGVHSWCDVACLCLHSAAAHLALLERNPQQCSELHGLAKFVQR